MGIFLSFMYHQKDIDCRETKQAELKVPEVKNKQTRTTTILIIQMLALHQNGVEVRQQFNGAIRTSLTAQYDVARNLLLTD